MTMLGRSRRHLRRYREIAGILARHGFGWIVDMFGITEVHSRHKHLPREQAAPVHLREMLEEEYVY